MDNSNLNVMHGIKHPTIINPHTDPSGSKPWRIMYYYHHNPFPVAIDHLITPPAGECRYVTGQWHLYSFSERVHDDIEELTQKFGGKWFNYGQVNGPVFPNAHLAIKFIDEVLDPRRLALEMSGIII